MEKEILQIWKKIDSNLEEEKLIREKYNQEFEDFAFAIISQKVKNMILEFQEKKEKPVLNYDFYVTLHQKLFDNVYPEISGETRQLPIEKTESLLKGKTIQYASPRELLYDGKVFLNKFEKELEERKENKRQQQQFFIYKIKEIWQKHYFYEGNTRTTALFADFVAMKYDIPFQLVNKDLKEFRNALVLATGKNDWEKLYSFFEENSKTKKVEKEETKASKKRGKEESREKKRKIPKKKNEREEHER